MRKNKGTGTLMKVCMLLFAVYSVYTIVSLQLQIQSKKAEQEVLKTTVEEQKLKNAELEATIENSEDPAYIAKIARDKLGYVSPGEKVFVNVTN